LSKYDKFPIVHVKVPVQYANVSMNPRRCHFLGYTGTVAEGCYERYYRIADGEVGAGQFFYHKRRKEGDAWWNSYRNITYSQLPEEIKKKIEQEDVKHDG
jgi:hypothetical protein